MKQTPGRDPDRSQSAATEHGLGALRSLDAVRHVRDPPAGHESNEHIVMLYRTRAEQFTVAVPFVRQGIERGEKCIYVVDDNPKTAFLGALREDGVAVEAARDSGALTVLTRETYVSGDEFGPDDQLERLADSIEAAAREYPTVRVAVEMTCFLGGDIRFEDLITYEERYNDLSVDVDAMALCQYNQSRFPADVLRGAVRAHPHLIADRTVRHNAYYRPPEGSFDTG